MNYIMKAIEWNIFWKKNLFSESDDKLKFEIINQINSEFMLSFQKNIFYICQNTQI